MSPSPENFTLLDQSPHLPSRGLGERASDFIADLVGSWRFIIVPVEQRHRLADVFAQALSLSQLGKAALSATTSFGTITTAVPEPSTWLMMLFGFAFLGRAIRRQRPVTDRLAAQAA